MKCARLVLAPCLALALTGCEVVDSRLLAGSREYFPRAELVKPRGDVVRIETHVGNVTTKFASEVFRALLHDRGSDLSRGLWLAGYRWFILGFEGFSVVWDTRHPEDFAVLDAVEYAAWVRRPAVHRR